MFNLNPNTMRITTKLMLALAVTGSLALTSCKDYDEDNYNNALINRQEIDEQVQEQLSTMETELKALIDAKNSCDCDMTQYFTKDEINKLFENYSSTTSLEEYIDDQLENYIKVTVYDQKIEALETAIAETKEITSALDDTYATETELQELESRLQTQISANDAAIKTNATSISALNTTVEGLSTTVTSNTERITTLETNLGTAQIDIKTNADAIEGLKTIVEGLQNETVDLSSYYTKEEIDKTLENYATVEELEAQALRIDSLNEKIDSVDNALTEYINGIITTATGQLTTAFTDVWTAINGNSADIAANTASIDSIKIVLDSKADTLTVNDLIERVETLETTVEEIQDDLTQIKEDIADLVAAVASLQDALAKQVTGIVVQQVYNPAFGSYNSLLSNLQTNALVAYYGVAGSASETFGTRQGDYIFNGEDGADGGYVYLTINPSSVDFTGLEVTLVNSIDEACSMKLSALEPVTDPLTLGYTRADNVPVYRAKATVAEADFTDSSLKMTIDKSQIASTVKDLLTIRSTSDAKLALGELAETVATTVSNLQLDAQGVKAAWTDSLGEHSVYSNFNIGAMCARPLSFNALDGAFSENGFYWTSYESARNLISSLASNAASQLIDGIMGQINVDGIVGELENFNESLTSLGNIQMTTSGDIITEVTIDLGTMEVTIPEFEIEIPTTELLNEALNDEIYTYEPDVPCGVTVTNTIIYNTYDENGDPVEEDGIKTIQSNVVLQYGTITIDITKEDIVNQDAENTVILVPAMTVPVELGKITTDVAIPADVMNDILEDVAEQLNASLSSLDMSNLIDMINSMLSSINNIESYVDTSLNSVFNYLDKLAQGVATVTLDLMKPVLLFSDGTGISIAGFNGAPTTTSKTNVYVIPTTYSVGLAAPVAKAKIEVNGTMYDAEPNQSLAITLQSGSNTVTYYALDYSGVEIARTYTIVVE